MKRQTPEQAMVAGSKIKATLAQIETDNPGLVRLDWLRFSVPLDALLLGCPGVPVDLDALAVMDRRGRDTVRDARRAGIEHDGFDNAMQVSKAGAAYLVEILAGALEVGHTEDRGMDYYSVRTALMHCGEVVGWVLAGGKSRAQAGTVHFNLFGSALLNIPVTRYAYLRSWLESSNATITRVDLSLDIWKGLDISDVPKAWLAGAFDVRGKRPKQAEQGSWTAGHSRTFYVGSRASGKLARVYEKGDELFGHEHGDEWVRIEVEYRNACRIIDYGVLDRPGDYFAGAYKWCADRLEETRAQFEAESIKKVNDDTLKDVTVQAAVTRVARWIKRTAAPAIAAFLDHSGDAFFTLIEGECDRVTGRLKGFDRPSLRRAFEHVAAQIAPSPIPTF